MQIWFVVIVPTYFIFDTVSKDLLANVKS